MPESVDRTSVSKIYDRATAQSLQIGHVLCSFSKLWPQRWSKTLLQASWCLAQISQSKRIFFSLGAYSHLLFSFLDHYFVIVWLVIHMNTLLFFLYSGVSSIVEMSHCTLVMKA